MSLLSQQGWSDPRLIQETAVGVRRRSKGSSTARHNSRVVHGNRGILGRLKAAVVADITSELKPVFFAEKFKGDIERISLPTSELEK